MSKSDIVNTVAAPIDLVTAGAASNYYKNRHSTTPGDNGPLPKPDIPGKQVDTLDQSYGAAARAAGVSRSANDADLLGFGQYGATRRAGRARVLLGE